MIQIDTQITPESLLPTIEKVFDLSAVKIESYLNRWRPEEGTPVFTVQGKYTSRGWTEWTQGFLFGSAILQYDVTSEKNFLDRGKNGTLKYMAGHLSHIGVHDHGFNNVSTYGNLLRLLREGRIPENEWEKSFYELALKISGAVQASRWTQTGPDSGYIYSFNGPHSLFADTIRSLRVLAISHQFGHTLMGEKDRRINLLERLIQHADSTSRYNVYFGEGRDAYDIRGRVVHESIFNLNDGSYRCPSTQQGYSPFSTWTRGLAWIICGYAEELEFLESLKDEEFAGFGNKKDILGKFLKTALATADFYLEFTPVDGVPYWDTGAPGLSKMGDYLNHNSDPYNDYEPVDSSAAGIAGQGLLRLGRYLKEKGKKTEGEKYFQAGLTVSKNLFKEPYLSEDIQHEGLILHSIYHRPNGWDYIPKGSKIPNGESSMWGDYHARELALMIYRMAKGEPDYYYFIR